MSLNVIRIQTLCYWADCLLVDLAADTCKTSKSGDARKVTRM